MQLPFSLYLALKYLKPKRTFLSAVTVISVLGVMLGVMVLVIVLSVMNGFDNMWRDKILGFNSHIVIESFGPLTEVEAVLRTAEETANVKAAAPFVQGLVFVQVDERVATPLVRGVDAERERNVSLIPEHMQQGRFSVEDDEVLLGSDLARQLGVETGDTLLVHSPRSFADPDELYLPEELTVSGVYELGMYEIDVGFIITSLDTARALCGLVDGVSAIQVMVEDPLRVNPVANDLKNQLEHRYLVRTWEDMNRQMFAALKVEKNLIFVLLLFIILVAAFSITNTLITTVVMKTREVGLLRSIGFTQASIMRVFVWQGVIYGAVGTAFGFLLGLLFLRYRNDILRWLDRGLDYEVLPKELYHLSELPAATSMQDMAMILVSVFVICTLAGVIPAYRAARLEPSKALRYE